VFVGRDRALDRLVAVKLLDGSCAQSADPAGHARFLREGPSSARFTHPNAVTVFDAGDDGGRLFIVMEYVAGGSLAERIATRGPLADVEVTRVGSQLLGALEAAHAAGLVHRDVKPSNVLLDESGSVKLADSTISAARSPRLARRWGRRGTWPRSRHEANRPIRVPTSTPSGRCCTRLPPAIDRRPLDQMPSSAPILAPGDPISTRPWRQ